jgi:hypothetical protein
LVRHGHGGILQITSCPSHEFGLSSLLTPFRFSHFQFLLGKMSRLLGSGANAIRRQIFFNIPGESILVPFHQHFEIQRYGISIVWETKGDPRGVFEILILFIGSSIMNVFGHNDNHGRVDGFYSFDMMQGNARLITLRAFGEQAP